MPIYNLFAGGGLKGDCVAKISKVLNLAFSAFFLNTRFFTAKVAQIKEF